MAEERIIDVEKNEVEEAHLANHRVHSLAWEGVNVCAAKLTNPIIADVDGLAGAGMSNIISFKAQFLTVLVIGELMAIMGPSGSGKTTLLNALAHRKASFSGDFAGSITVNGAVVSTGVFQSISSYVEQEDALIGSLTVRETLDFAARLSLSR